MTSRLNTVWLRCDDAAELESMGRKSERVLEEGMIEAMSPGGDEKTRTIAAAEEEGTCKAAEQGS